MVAFMRMPITGCLARRSQQRERTTLAGNFGGLLPKENAHFAS
jgi:hypothetical protein